MQADVDAAPLFASVLESFNEWLCSKQLGTKLSYAVVCDGPWDCGRFLRNQCKYSQVLDSSALHRVLPTVHSWNFVLAAIPS